mmetsp:Transcript_4234/g.11999  ORF Transcript_4234/g.11999 Transcript_4234/m.11999 type:complete len:391 (+) Transcript_4234:1237-2409(+)
MPSDHWQYHVQLHDVVHRHQHQQRKRPLLVVGPLGPLQQASTNDEALECVPISQLVKVLPFLEVALVRVLPLRALWLPTGVEAEAKSLLAVDVQPHEPEDREEGPDGALVLVVAAAAAARGAVDLVELELRERRPAVLEEHAHVVLRVADALGGVLRTGPVRVLPPHHLGHRVGGLPGAPGGHGDGLGRLNPALEDGLLRRLFRPLRLDRVVDKIPPVLLVALLMGHPAGEGGEVLDEALAIIRWLPAILQHDPVLVGLLPGDHEVRALRQAERTEVLDVLRLHCHLVDAVDGLQSRIRVRVLHLLGELVRVRVQHEALLLCLVVQPEALCHRERHRLLPRLREGHPHGDGPVRVLGRAIELRLRSHDQDVGNAEDLRRDPDLDDLQMPQ